jgi:predicted Zn-dependent protease
MLFMLALHLLCGAVPAGATASVPEDDEKRLWLRAEEEEKKLDGSGMIYRNAQIDEYLDSVIRKLASPEQLKAVPIRVSVIKDRVCNAFAFPNGRIYIHSGMLSAMENEAQLATLLGHESVHALNHHMLSEIRDAKGKTAFSATLGALTGGFLLPFGQLGALASIRGYSRDMESEADSEGFRMLVRAGYDPAEAPKIFIILQKEAAAEDRKEAFFFASHPKLQDRIDNYEYLLKSEYADRRVGDTNTERFLRAIGPLLLDSAEMDIKAGRYESARGSIGRYISGNGETARAVFLLGESYRQSGQKEDAPQAADYYLKAVTIDPAYPDPHRIIGMLAYKRKDREQARKSLERYLELSPNAADRGYIKEMLKNMH